jgi:hypothetical protein
MAKRTGPGRALLVKQVLAVEEKKRISPTQKAIKELVSLGADQEQLLIDLDNILLNPPPNTVTSCTVRNTKLRSAFRAE